MKKEINIANQRCEYTNINTRKKCISLWFAIVNIAIFVIFIGVFTFGRNLLASLIAPGITWGVIVEPALIVIALIMSLIYYIFVERLEANQKERSNEHYR